MSIRISQIATHFHKIALCSSIALKKIVQYDLSVSFNYLRVRNPSNFKNKEILLYLWFNVFVLSIFYFSRVIQVNSRKINPRINMFIIYIDWNHHSIHKFENINLDEIVLKEKSISLVAVKGSEFTVHISYQK